MRPPARFRAPIIVAAILLSPMLSACGGAATSTTASSSGAGTRTVTIRTAGATAPADLGFPYVATKNTTRVAGADPVEDAAAVALATYPSTAPGTHPTAVTLAPTDDWQAALAASSLVASPFSAPILLSAPRTLPNATAQALRLLAPTGSDAAKDAQVIRVGDVPAVPGVQAVGITAGNPYAIAAAIDAFEAQKLGRQSANVVIASAQYPAYAMPAAGYAAESGTPILFVNSADVPTATQDALIAAHRPHIYVLGPESVIPQNVAEQLAHFGQVVRIAGATAAATSVAFAEYRYPACPDNGEQCVHEPGTFGWAIRSPGHGYVLLSTSRPLDAAASAALSASGSYGPQLLIEQPNTLPQAVLNYFVDYATPGYAGEGPTSAVYNHAWLIGGGNVLSTQLQGQVDSLLEVVPTR